MWLSVTSSVQCIKNEIVGHTLSSVSYGTKVELTWYGKTSIHKPTKIFLSGTSLPFGTILTGHNVFF